jgi:hypothetical protein
MQYSWEQEESAFLGIISNNDSVCINKDSKKESPLETNL